MLALILQHAFFSKENFEISSGKGVIKPLVFPINEEKIFARSIDEINDDRPRIELLSSVYFYDERRRIERFFR